METSVLQCQKTDSALGPPSSQYLGLGKFLHTFFFLFQEDVNLLSQDSYAFSWALTSN